jgi:DNA-binding CsgD family transcriptional regulator
MTGYVAPRMGQRLYRALLAPQTTGELGRRRETVLSALLLGSLALCVVALAVAVVEEFVLPHGPRPPASQFVVVAAATLLFGGLLAAARRGHRRRAAVAVLAFYYLAALSAFAQWSIDLPAGVLVAALLVIVTGVLGGPRVAVAAVAGLTISMAVFAALDSAGVLVPDRSWTAHHSRIGDAVIYGTVLALMAFVIATYTRETTRTLNQLVSGGAATSPLARLRTKDLSVREVEVVRLLTGGLTNQEIAQRLFVSPRTVQTHVANALKKTGATSRTGLAVLAVQEGLVAQEGEPAP